MFRFDWRCRLVAALLPLAAACGSSLHSQTRPTTVVAVAPAVESAAPAQLAPLVGPVPGDDPVQTLIATADRHFKTGQQELEQGHFEAAKQEFNRAVDVLLESSYGARTEPRIREFFDRLVDRISAYEVRALAEGDGFTEKKYEPASIDELLALSTTVVPPPTAAPELKQAVASDPVVHDVPIPFNQRVLAYIELFQGRLHDFIEDGMRRGSKY